MSHIWQQLKETTARKDVGGIEMECKCPSGYPKRIQHDFGSGAKAQALQWSIPVPGFEVEAHTGECSLKDAVKVPLLSFEGSSLHEETTQPDSINIPQ